MAEEKITAKAFMKVWCAGIAMLCLIFKRLGVTDGTIVEFKALAGCNLARVLCEILEEMGAKDD